jgi:hypothetical protein
MNPAETFTVEAAKLGYTAAPQTVGPLYCKDKVVNFEMHGCDTVSVSGWVEDKETGLPIDGGVVEALNCVDWATSPIVAGFYSIDDLAFDPDCTTWVFAWKEGYNGAADSVFIPCGDEALISFQLHQTPMMQIMLYYGNGSSDDGTGYNSAATLFESLGYIVDYTDDWPTDPDLEEYKVIFLLGPGNDNGDPASDDFTPGQIAQLDLFLRNGGRLVVMTDGAGATVPDVENKLLAALNDLQLAFVDPTVAIADALANDIDPTDQLMGGVATLDFGTAVEVGTFSGDPGDLAALPAGDVIVAADTMPGVTRLGAAGFAGDVVAIGDLDWMDDGSFMGDITEDGYVWPDWPADNENLLLNIIGF